MSQWCPRRASPACRRRLGTRMEPGSTRNSRQIVLIGLFSAKYARRIFAIVSTTSIPNLAPVSPTEATVDPPSRGSRLDADHPENGVLIPCRSTLDKRIGPDGRISEWAYDWTARLMKILGFRDLKQIDGAIADYSDDQLNSIAMGSRQGQITRFELMLLAALGERFIERHPWSDSETLRKTWV